MNRINISQIIIYTKLQLHKYIVKKQFYSISIDIDLELDSDRTKR